MHKHGSALTGLKDFCLKNSLFWLLLATQNVTHVTNSAVISVHSVVFSEGCCMEIHKYCYLFVRPRKCFKNHLHCIVGSKVEGDQ